MFYKLGIKQILKNKKVLALSVLVLSLGVGILFTVGIAADTVQYAIESRTNSLFGNVDYTVYRSGTQFYDNTTFGIPYNYSSTIRAVPGVDHVVARATAFSQYYTPIDSVVQGNDVAAIDVENPDERTIGIANITSYDPAIGTGTKSLEDLLEWEGVLRPVVIGDRVSLIRGLSIGDEISILPQNATKLYATPVELLAANTTAKRLQLEASIRNNVTRFQNDTFTIVGIIIDGSEAPPKAFAKDAETRTSLSGLVPPDECIYVRMNDSFHWIFNKNYNYTTKSGKEVGFFLVDTASSYTGGDGMFGDVVKTSTGNATIIANDIRAAFQGYIDYVTWMIRGILGVLIVSAMFSCAVLIKTTTQMNVEEKTREIGILRAVGFKKGAISEIITSQILFTTTLGVGIGLLVGMIPPNFFNVSEISRYLSYNKQYAVDSIGIAISLTSVLITMAAGIVLPMVSGLAPLLEVRRRSIVEMINPMYMQLRESGTDYSYPLSIRFKAWKRLRKAHRYFDALWIWKNIPHVAVDLVEREIERWNKNKNPFVRLHKWFLSATGKSSGKQSLGWLVVMAASCVFFYVGATHLFPNEGSFRFDIEEMWYWAVAAFGGMVFLLISVLQIGSGQISGLSSIFARLSKWRIGPIASYIPKSIQKHSRNVRNLIGMLTMGVVLVSSLTILSDTIQVGNSAQNHSYLGSDAIVFNPPVPRSSLSEVRALPGIKSATIYAGVTMDSWKYNFDRAYSYVVNTADSYGGKHSGVTQNLNVVVIEPGEYLQNNPYRGPIHNEFDPAIPSLYEIDEPNQFEDPSAFIHRLDAPMTTIVATSLLGTLGKDIGDTVTLSINGFMGTLTIVGAASFLPAVPYMRLMDSEDGLFQTRSMVISRSTFSSMLGDFVGNVDIMIKNMTIPSSLMNHTVSGSAAGYASGLIDYNAINATLAAIPGVDKIAYRFSTFAPGAPSLNATYNSSQLVWKHNNTHITEGEEFPLPFRMFVVNGLEDIWMTGKQEVVSEAIPWLSNNFGIDYQAGLPGGPRNHRASEVLRTIDTTLGYTKGSSYPRTTVFGNTSACVVNRYAVAYEDIDNETYVYEMKPGNKITFSMENSTGSMIRFNFTVAATLDNQVAYWWNNGSMREGYKLSSKSLNYNFKENETSELQDLFDLDANVFITTRRELGYMATELFGSLAQFVGIEELNGLAANELANHVQVKIDAGANVTAVANAIRLALNAMPFGNYSVFEYKRAFIDKLANTGALAVEIQDDVSETAALQTLKSWYEANGYEWNLAHVGTVDRLNFNSDINVVGPIFRIFFVVAIFSLLISAVGLCTILYRNARKRNREYGIYKALGYTNQAIRDMIYFETFLVTSIGVITGTIAGIVVMWILFEAVKSTLILPMLFSIPIFTLSSVFLVLIAVSAATSKSISSHFAKLSTIEAIRYKE